MFEAEEQGRDAFQRRDSWWRLQYEIVEEPQPPAPNEPAALVIKALPDSKLEWYDPLHTGEPPPKQGTHRKYEHEHQSTPHMHLARLDLASQDEVLGFVNTWGLLGLWEVPDYQGFHPLVHPDRGFHEEFGETRAPFSRWYLDERYMSLPPSHPDYLRRYCEPFCSFISAAKAFQSDAVFAIEAMKEGDPQSEAQARFTLQGHRMAPAYDKDSGTCKLGWHCHSLYDWIRLRYVLDMTTPNGIRRCGRCGKVFISSDPRTLYCNNACRSAKTSERTRARQRALQLYSEGVGIEEVAARLESKPETVAGWVSDLTNRKED